MSRIATIDIGTNTTLLLVAERRADGGLVAVEDRAEITRLGRGIGTDGRLGHQGIDATLAALRTYAELAASARAPLFAIGTEGLRRAPNANDFLTPAAALLGVPVEVIAGEREADLTFLAAARSFPEVAKGAMQVIDIGGGSTEIVIADGGRVGHRCSVPLGSVRLTEKHLRHDPPTEDEHRSLRGDIAECLRGVPFASAGTSVPTLVGIAGTVTSLAAMAQGLRSYDPNLVHGYRLERQVLNAMVERLARATAAERETMPGLDPRRADVIFAGCCILNDIAAAAGAPSVLVSDRGIRWGLAHEKLDGGQA